MTRFSSEADILQRQEQDPLEGYLKVVAFFFSALFLGIPALLAYNYYIQRGARRKAREWAGWAIGGLFFFFTMRLLSSLH